MKDAILSAKPSRVMWKLSLPGIAGMLLFGLNQLIDGIFVGNFIGETALGGVSLSLPLAQLFLGLGGMVGTGAASLLSMALGAQDQDKQRRLLPNMTALSLILAAATMLCGLLFSAPLVRLMGGTGELFNYGNRYLRVIVIGAFFPIWGLGGNFLIRSEGKMGRAMGFAAAGLTGNIILNYLFIRVWGWGVAGAAWATNAGMLIYAVTNVVYFSSKAPSFDARVFSLRFDPDLLPRIAALGLPSMILQLMTLVQQLVAYRLLVSQGGPGDVAFFGTVLRIFFVANLPIIGMMRSLQPVVGMNYGARIYSRVRRSVRCFAVAMTSITTAVWLLLILFPASFLSLMLPDHTFLGSEIFHFRLYMSVLPLLPATFITMSYLPSVGKSTAVSILGLSRQVLLFIPSAFVLSALFGLSGVYYALFATDIIISLVAIILLLRDLGSLPLRDGNTLMQKESI